MNKNNKSLIVTFMGIIVLCMFSGVLIFNMYKTTGKSYFAKITDKSIKERIEVVRLSDTQIKLIAKSNIISYCIKNTVSNPAIDNICWKDITNNEVIVRVLKKEKYYLWILDDNYIISDAIYLDESTISTNTINSGESINTISTQEIEIKYNYNLFDANMYMENDIITGYNSDLQIIPFNGNWKSVSFALGKVPGIKLKTGEKYKIRVNYVGGKYTAGSNPPRIIMEFQNNDKNFTGRKWGTHYIDGVLPASSANSFEKIITVTSDVAANATNLYFWLYQKTSGGTTFSDNYRVQVFITKEESKIVNTNEAYGSMPQPTKDGYLFDGWYDSLSGNNKITENSIISKGYTHTLYAHWSKVTLKKDGLYTSLTSANDVKGYYFSKTSMKLNGNENGWINSTKKNIDFILLPGKHYIYIKYANNKILEKSIEIKTSDIVDTNNAKLLTQRLDKYLSSKGSSLNELNNLIYRSVKIAQVSEQTFDITEDSIRKAIVDYAYFLLNNKKDEIKYISPGSKSSTNPYPINYEKLYNGEYTHTYDSTKKVYTQLGMDCNAFVSFVLYNALQSNNYLSLFEEKKGAGGFSTIAGPMDSAWTIHALKYLEKSKFYKLSPGQNIKTLAKNNTFRNSLLPGDIIGIVGYNKVNYNSEAEAKSGKSSHIMIYVGDGKYIHNTSRGVSLGSLDEISYGNLVGSNYGATNHGGITIISPKSASAFNEFSIKLLNTYRYLTGKVDSNKKGIYTTFYKENISRQGVAASALALSQVLYKKYKIKIPYGGSAATTGINGEWGYLEKSGTIDGKSYKNYSGLTCGEFVSWNLTNLGFNITSGAGSSRFYTGCGYSYGTFVELNKSTIKEDIKKVKIGDVLTLETKEDHKSCTGRHVSNFVASDSNGTWVVEANAGTFFYDNQLHVYDNKNYGIVTTYDKYGDTYRWESLGDLSRTYNNYGNNKLSQLDLTNTGF